MIHFIARTDFSLIGECKIAKAPLEKLQIGIVFFQSYGIFQAIAINIGPNFPAARRLCPLASQRQAWPEYLDSLSITAYHPLVSP